jgi:hypothetical protein
MQTSNIHNQTGLKMKQETKTRTLHFTVHPSIINLPRSLYWYEEKQDKAFKILDSLSCGKLNLNQCKDLLEGDAYFITEDGGRTLTLINKPDKEWKKELTEHKKFLEKREKERIKEKEEQQRQLYDKTVTEELETLQRDVNIMKGLNALDNPINEERKIKDFNTGMAKQIWFEEFKEKDPEKKQNLKLLRESFQNKTYNFMNGRRENQRASVVG